MIQRIKNWFNNCFNNYKEKRRRKQTLKIIKKAKRAYLDGEADCICRCFMWVEPSFLCYKDIVKRIPEFKPTTFIDEFYPYNYFSTWWPVTDRESRINAFNKLIEIYSK